uniref:Protein SCAI n=1 Tax=Diabrotica virgifera virgifera TaxID=50390 RepID=A0A6P7GKE9_DIAVI
MVGMANMDEHERKIVMEFVHLLEKSKQLFNGLRDLPQYGHKQWQAYFGRTFDIYTKLWKFQQQHRQILDTKYGLKRWQIGEIASKIGQLYYHYYLRTSETNYLNEAYSFYAAIRGRAYYSRAAKEDRSELMVKKLRYYARFIVVCLLLRRMKLVRELIVELDRHIADYTSTYEPDDQIEWSLVLDEIKGFIQSDSLVQVLHADTNPIVLSHRYIENGDRPSRRENPHKYLLYKPTLSHVLVFLASGFKELPTNGALLLYLSADGCFSTTKHPEDNQQHNGSLFTLFLHSPLTAFCYCCNLTTIPIHHWERCQSFVDRFVTEASRLFTRSRVESSYLQFFGDDFLRLLLLRYVFCDVVLHLHRAFKGRQYRPRCQPPLPEAELLEHPSLQHLVLDLAAHLEVR